MARKAAANIKRSHAFHEVMGLALIAVAVLLICAFWSYNPDDLVVNRVPANDEAANWVGIIGAWVAFGTLFFFGAAAFLIPLLLIGFSLGHFSERLGYLRRRWGASLLLLGTVSGALDLYNHHFTDAVRRQLTTPTMGGLGGEKLNQYLFDHFGMVGASVLFGLILLFCTVAFTDYRLGAWVRQWIERRRAAKESRETDEEKLQKRARDLAKEAKKLQEEAQKAGLGADLEPVPEPTIKDNTAPPEGDQRKRRKSKKKKKEVSPFADEDTDSGQQEQQQETEREVPAASKESVLGQTDRPNINGVDKRAAGESTGKSSKEEQAPKVTDASAPRLERGGAKKSALVTPATGPSLGKDYHLPVLDHLKSPELPDQPSETKDGLMANAKLMQSTLAQFGIEVTLGDITKGPTITRFELNPAPGVKLEKITNLSNNIAAAMKAERINVLAPIPGKGSVGIEVPNKVKTQVVIREIMESPEWQKSKANIPLALGKDVYGNPVIGDLAEMPHLLIAGSTGSGKSVCISGIIGSLLYQFSPEDLRFVMIDPKVVELQQYNKLPHLIVPVVTESKKVVTALKWVVNEMEKRYQIFAKAGVRNIQAFNRRSKQKEKSGKNPAGQETTEGASSEGEQAAPETGAGGGNQASSVPRDDEVEIPDRLSYIVVIIDELADLMLVAPSDVEMAIARITQMARAAGIHCIVATQRPSVNVITGVIKANIPARIAFQVAAKVDSRTILDVMGAEKLLGKGDMLYQPPGSAQLVRAQGAYITDEEIQSVVDAISEQAAPSYESEIHEKLQQSASASDNESGSDEDEDIIQQCVEVIRTEQRASVSLLQRRLRLGYTRAARIMDELEGRGIVGPSRGPSPARSISTPSKEPDRDVVPDVLKKWDLGDGGLSRNQ